VPIGTPSNFNRCRTQCQQAFLVPIGAARDHRAGPRPGFAAGLSTTGIVVVCVGFSAQYHTCATLETSLDSGAVDYVHHDRSLVGDLKKRLAEQAGMVFSCVDPPGDFGSR